MPASTGIIINQRKTTQTRMVPVQKFFLYTAFTLGLLLSLNSCVMIESILFKPKKQNCPAYFKFWNSGKEKKKKKKDELSKEGVVVTPNGDSVGVQMVRVPRNENGLIDKKQLKANKKNPDPRTGYKPKRKPFDPEKHN